MRRLENGGFRLGWQVRVKISTLTIILFFQVLHRDIENHGKIVSSVVKLCKRTDASCNTANVRRVANGLERRWHLLFLRSLEWQCYIESLSKRDIYRVSCCSVRVSYYDYSSLIGHLQWPRLHPFTCSTEPLTTDMID